MPDIQDKDLWADITPTRTGWSWRITGDVPLTFRHFRDERGTEWVGPGGSTGTRWGARREARRALAEIRAYQAKESEVIR